MRELMNWRMILNFLMILSLVFCPPLILELFQTMDLEENLLRIFFF
jgi:hypothetical protein